MADNFLITGYHGEPHVTAENDRGINAAIFGAGRYVLPVGKQFQAEYIGNNTVRIFDGKLMDNGAAAGIPAGEYIDLLIPNASQGMSRNDLIVFQYVQDASTLIEKGTFEVVTGTEVSGTPADPTLTQEDLLSGNATFDQMALWRVFVSGTAISAPVKVFSAASIGSDVELDENMTIYEDGTLKTLSGEEVDVGSSATSTTVTLTTTGWVEGDDNRFYQTKTVSGMTPNIPVVIVDAALTGTDVDADVAVLEAWLNSAAGHNVKQNNGSLTFYTYEVPSVNIPVYVGVA